jgi:hypothetical protein
MALLKSSISLVKSSFVCTIQLSRDETLRASGLATEPKLQSTSHKQTRLQFPPLSVIGTQTRSESGANYRAKLNIIVI